jgi:hypothetical protein
MGMRQLMSGELRLVLKMERLLIADKVIHCVGQLDRPKFGMTKMLEGYKGKYWHTNPWRILGEEGCGCGLWE